MNKMPKIILRTRGAEKTPGENLVAEFKSFPVALMQPKPEIMLWGSRYFTFSEQFENGDLVYVEGMCWPLLPGHTCEELT